MNNNVFDPRKEWESLQFPVEISNLSFDKNLNSLPSSCVIKIWRDENFNLRASATGHILNAQALDIDAREEGPGNFALEDRITGYATGDSHEYVLSGCVVGSFNIEGVFYPNLGTPFKADIHIDSITRKLKDYETKSSFIQYDWFVCAKVSLLFPGNTYRFNKDGVKRIRKDVDNYEKVEEIRPISMSRDFVFINQPGAKCILSKVPAEFKLKWADCFCIEYRTSLEPFPNKEIKNATIDFMSFLLGTELLPIGSTVFNEEKLVSQVSMSPTGNNVIHKCLNGSKPPIKFNWKYDWGKIDYLTDKLFPTYLENLNTLNLDGILWRFFQAKDMAVGVNLPTLSSALEVLVNNYLKAHKEISTVYLDQHQFDELIRDEINSISKKLEGHPNQQQMLNKIASAFKRGSNEKMELFFEHIKLPLSKIERDALKARNSMAHGGSDAKSIEKAKKLILHTRAYETLFHRVLLKVLGYEEYYVDYYLSGTKVKNIDNPTGPK